MTNNPALDKALARLSKALRTCQGTEDRPRARRSARARSLSALRLVRAALDREFPTLAKGPNQDLRLLNTRWIRGSFLSKLTRKGRRMKKKMVVEGVAKGTYPEHEKLHAIKEKSQACGDFLEWLLGPRRYHIGEYHVHTDACWDEGESQTERRRTCGTPTGVLYPTSINVRKLLAEFFEISEEKIETEKRAILDVLQQSLK